MAKQVAFGIFAEGVSDYRFLTELLSRYLPQVALEMDKDLEIVPAISMRNQKQSGDTFLETMRRVESVSAGLHCILVHMDADSRTEDEVIKNKWQPWIEEAVIPKNWVPIIPITMIESWMLTDVEVLSDVFVLEERIINSVLSGRRVENIGQPKEVLNQIHSLSDYEIEYEYLQETLGKRIRFGYIEKSSSFVKFKERLSNVIRNY